MIAFTSFSTSYGCALAVSYNVWGCLTLVVSSVKRRILSKFGWGGRELAEG